MSSKRKVLLGVTILIIAACYGFVFYSIINHSDTPKQSQIIRADQLEHRENKPNAYLKKESKYKGNQLENGTSPFDACFGQSIYNGNASLTIKNGARADAIVCLYSYSLNRTIRNEYVQKKSSFIINKISQGTYKIRVFYGNDWNPTSENPCGVKGYFDSDVTFSEFDGTEYFKDSDDGYTVATVTLYTVADGNASTSRINQSDFFGN